MAGTKSNLVDSSGLRISLHRCLWPSRLVRCRRLFALFAKATPIATAVTALFAHLAFQHDAIWQILIGFPMIAACAFTCLAVLDLLVSELGIRLCARFLGEAASSPMSGLWLSSDGRRRIRALDSDRDDSAVRSHFHLEVLDPRTCSFRPTVTVLSQESLSQRTSAQSEVSNKIVGYVVLGPQRQKQVHHFLVSADWSNVQFCMLHRLNPNVCLLEETKEGFFLHRFAVHDSDRLRWLSDTWHSSLRSAKQQAKEEFGVDEACWRALEDQSLVDALRKDGRSE